MSVRTIYRDIDALSAQGVPIYADLGRDGGYSLLGSYKTDLTGLSAKEAQALQLIGIDGPLKDIGREADLRTSLVKLSAALSKTVQEQQQWVREKILIDSAFASSSEESSILAVLHTAVMQERQLRIRYRIPFLLLELEYTLSPYSLVWCLGTWRLVYERKNTLKTIALEDITAAELMEETFVRRRTYELRKFWEQWKSEESRKTDRFSVILLAEDSLLRHSRYFFDQRKIEGLGATSERGEWRKIRIRFSSFEEARRVLLACGGSVEVLAPRALRFSLHDFAKRAAERNALS